MDEDKIHFLQGYPVRGTMLNGSTDYSLILGSQFYYLYFPNEQIKQSCKRAVDLPQASQLLCRRSSEGSILLCVLSTRANILCQENC